MSTQLSLTPNADRTVPSYLMVLEELSAIVFDHPELYPREHSPDYFRKQIRGEREMTMKAFEAACDKIVRRYGNVGIESIDRLFATWKSRWTSDGFVPLQKTIEDEILEAQLARARFDIDVEEARTTGCDRKRRDAKRAADRAIKEIRDVVAHPAMQVTA